MIVVDTNVISYLYINGEQSSLSDVHWIAPRLWQSEFRNVLALYLRQDLLSLTRAKAIILKAERRMRYRTFVIPSELVMNLVTSSACSAYDCEFVALAQEQKVPLVTFDKKLLREFPETAVSPQTFLV